MLNEKGLSLRREQSQLPKAYPPDAPPATVLDYRSRIMDQLHSSVSKSSLLGRLWYRYQRPLNYTTSVVRVASTILGLTIVSVYAANVVVVYEKEARIEWLQSQKVHLMKRLKELEALSSS